MYDENPQIANLAAWFPTKRVSLRASGNLHRTRTPSLPGLLHLEASQNLGSLDGQRSPAPARGDVHERFTSANDAWCVQTYIQLRRRGVTNAYLTDRYRPGALCITSYEHLALRDAPFLSYVVTCRQDRGRPEICDRRIVQNQLNVRDESDHYMPLWAQPALQPRNPERGNRVCRVAYKGRLLNIAEPFRNEAFVTRLQEMGDRVMFEPH